MEVVKAAVTTSNGTGWASRVSCHGDDSSPVNLGQKHHAQEEGQKSSRWGAANSDCLEIRDIHLNEDFFLSRSGMS